MSIAREFLREAKKHNISVNEAKTPSFIGDTKDGFFAVKIDGLPEIKSFRDLWEHRKAIDSFKEKATKGRAGTKGKSYSAGVKRYIKDVEATQYFCYLPSRPGEKDDSVEVYYI